MSNLLSELEAAMWRIDNKEADYARMMSVGFLRENHAAIAAAVRDAAYGRALIDAMNCEYQAAKESRKGGKQEAWITTYCLLRRLKVAADYLTDAAMSAREGA